MLREKNKPFPTLRQNTYLHLVIFGHLHPLQLWLGAYKLRSQAPLPQTCRCLLHWGSHSPAESGGAPSAPTSGLGHLCDEFSSFFVWHKHQQGGEISRVDGKQGIGN